MKGYSLRDRIAWAICNFALNHIATEHYRKMISGSIRLGMMSAADEDVYNHLTRRFEKTDE